VKPGIYHDIPIEQYHADPSTVSKSGLDLIARTPLHYWAAHLDPDRPEREDTPAFVEGRAVHALALEGREVFDRQFAVAPRVDRRTKAGKEDWQAWADAHASHTILTAEQSERVEAMHAGLQRHEGARRYLGADGDAEVSIYWTNEATGVACRCRPDKIVPIPGTDEVVLVDLKTTRDGLDDETISRTLARYRYHVQAAWYVDGARAAGLAVRAFALVFIEKSRPHGARVVTMCEDSITCGRVLYRENLETYAECLASGQWPGYSTATETVSIPSWEMRRAGLI
jgi:exodeoxyribonuclease VIII